MSSTKRKALTTDEGNKKARTGGNASITSFFGVPKPVAAVTNGTAKGLAAATAPEATSVLKFDKTKWVEGLTEEQKQLLKLEIETLDDSWLAHLKDDVKSKDFLELKKFLAREEKAGKKVFPPKEDVYSWSRHTPFHTVKVVIVGQDPYHNHNQAHGLAFSVRPPTPAPPSLRNMYIALKKDYPTFTPPAKNGGLLTPWADRGVLMLNTCLTVRAHEANSHSNRGWEKFTQRVIDLVASKRTRGVVFMAWGTPAGKRVIKVDSKRHLVLKAVHPSPLSAARGFFDCGHFKKANEWLVTRYGEGSEIEWDLNPAATPPSMKKEVEKEVEKEKEKKTKDDVPPATVAISKDGVEEKSVILEKEREAGKAGVAVEDKNATDSEEEDEEDSTENDKLFQSFVSENY
ncbi:uracil-DNA glycosylase-like protein [Pseudomassariella vexata]|uniref:Uracil-DNA glycosylase n=1 Tax=Pseudomassariella vexata TaxID=1141098 RepID=A0A1Y2D6P7_9PEZI|nr:uracil-DNA glycosylase-like protein [Pseudomassariella vexata]ORY54824.1 uracil-DNA glycosylase-like protein [Pseudomassariella vexata]